MAAAARASANDTSLSTRLLTSVSNERLPIWLISCFASGTDSAAGDVICNNIVVRQLLNICIRLLFVYRLLFNITDTTSLYHFRLRYPFLSASPADRTIYVDMPQWVFIFTSSNCVPGHRLGVLYLHITALSTASDNASALDASTFSILFT